MNSIVKEQDKFLKKQENYYKKGYEVDKLNKILEDSINKERYGGNKMENDLESHKLASFFGFL